MLALLLRNKMISETFLARQKRQARVALPMALLLLCPLTGMAQRDRNSNYYRGMNQQVRRGDYNRYVQDDDRRHHHDDHDNGGGIGPGKAAMIGGAGGAALGAIFGRSLKGTLIGGAAGAGLGAIGGAIANHDNDHDRHHR